MKKNINIVVDLLKQKIDSDTYVKVRFFSLGKNHPDAAIVFLDYFVSKDIISRDILNPLMTQVDERIHTAKNKAEFLCLNYIYSGNTRIEQDIDKAVDSVKNGCTVLVVEDVVEFIIIDTAQSEYRTISDPENEISINGPRESFVEYINTNLAMLKRKIKDRRFKIHHFEVGIRSKTRLSIAYIEDIVDKNALSELIKRIRTINIDCVDGIGVIEQLLEKKTYSIFPQFLSTERPDKVVSNIMSGKIAILLDGNSKVLTAPSTFSEFYQAVDDYYNRTLVASLLRMLRLIAIIITLFLPSLYLTLLKFNSELIPVDFIVPIVQARSGISLTPFFEILIMETLVELLREGGLRLPSKIAPTLSIIGGIIIGDAAISSRMVSPTTLLIVGVTVVASFLIPNYEMSLSIRFLRFAILVLTNYMGMLGISASLIVLLVHLSALDSLGIPYMTFHKNDLKDIFVRAPIWQMKQRPSTIAGADRIRQKSSRKEFINEKNKSNK